MGKFTARSTKRAYYLGVLLVSAAAVTYSSAGLFTKGVVAAAWGWHADGWLVTKFGLHDFGAAGFRWLWQQTAGRGSV